VADTASSSGRLEVFGILREGLSLLPRAIGPFFIADVLGVGLMSNLVHLLDLPFTSLSKVLDVGGLGASSPVAKVAEALPLARNIVGWVLQAFVVLWLLVAHYRIAAEVRTGLQPEFPEVFFRHYPPLLPLASLVLVLGLGTLMGFSALVVPGVVFLLVFGQALPAMIFEGTNVRDSLAASWRLTPGNLLSLLGLTLSLLGLTLSLLLLAFVPSFLSYLVAKAVGPGASLLIVLPTVTVAIVLLFAVSCLPALVAVIVYQNLRAQVAGSIPAEQPETDGVPA
jgi:hypothetical protein